MIQLGVILLFLLFNGTTLVTVIIPSNELCPVALCTCKDIKAICRNHGKYLDHIPKFPGNTEIVEFIGNHLNMITANTFHNVSELKLAYLILAENDIRNISDNAFRDLSSLVHLDLSSNPRISRSDLRRSFGSLKFSTKGFLNLNSMRLTTKEISDILTNLDKGMLTVLSLEYNRIQHIDNCLFKDFHNLTYLKLTGNQITKITFNCVTGIKYLKMDSNKLNEVPNFCLRQNTTAVPDLTGLSLSNNDLSNLKSHQFTCIDKLRTLRLMENPFLYIDHSTFNQLQRLRYLEISSIFKYKPIILQKSLFSSSSMEHVKLRDFTFQSATSIYAENPHMGIFEGNRNLDSLDLSSNRLPSNPFALEMLFKPLFNLSTLTVRSVKWYRVPYHLLHKLPKLTSLDISDNWISYIDFDAFSHLSNLRILHLRNNRIISFGEISNTYTPFLRLIDLSRNTYNCSCNNINSVLSFFELLIKNNITIRHYPKDYYCTNPKSAAGKRINTVECKPRIDTIFYIISITVFSCFAVTTIAFKSRHQLRYWIHEYKSRHRRATRNVNQTQLYDGFVMYCEEDKMWLYTHFLPFIEEKNGYILCIHDRDFQYGRLIVDNIVENINKSKKIVLILSENFTRSSWCQFEVLLAHDRFVTHGPDSLVSIKLEDIAHDLMTNSLETLIKFATHAIWSEYEHSREKFWVKILDCFENQNGSNDLDIPRESYINRPPAPVYKTVNDNSSKEQTTNDNSSKEQTTNDNSSKEQTANDNSSKEQTTNDNSSKEHDHQRSKDTIEQKDINAKFLDIFSSVNKMSETLHRRIDCLEESVKTDIENLGDKLHVIENNIKLLQIHRTKSS